MAYELCKKTKEKYSGANPNQAGTGAAGGLGFAFLSYTNAVLESGVKIILEETKLESFIKNADFVITGEGRLDGQTVMGKAPIGVAEIAKNTRKKFLLLADASQKMPHCVTNMASTHFSLYCAR